MKLNKFIKDLDDLEETKLLLRKYFEILKDQFQN